MDKVREMRERNSGQVLLIAAFIMAFLLLSAELYIFEVGNVMSEFESNSLTDFVLNIKLSSRHIVIGALANASNGGSISVLELNLQRWASLIDKQYRFGKSILNYTLEQNSPYSSGIWMDWGTNGLGVSSAAVNFAYKLSGREMNLNQSYFLNITTTLLVESTYRGMLGNDKQINVTIRLLNEANAALAKQIIIYYYSEGNWLIPTQVNNYSILDYGNGTYLASFTASIPGQDVQVSAHVVDQREIYVRANATSTQI